MNVRPSTDFAAAALRYHTLGVNIVAITPGIKGPRYRWKQFHTRRQTIEEVQALPWQGAPGLGVVDGFNDVRSFDLDKCPSFDPVLTMLQRLGLAAEYPWVVRSGSGNGWHIHLRCTEAVSDLADMESDTKGVYKAPGIGFDHLELRWERVQTILPPSTHVSGGIYTFQSAAPTEPPALVTGKQIADAFRAVTIQKPITVFDTTRTPVTPAPDYSAYANKALLDELALIEQAPVGDRNAQLNASAFALGQLVAAGVLDQGIVEQGLQGAARQIGLDRREIVGTIRSGIAAGLKQPRILPERDRPVAHIKTTGHAPEAPIPFVPKLKSLRDLMALNLPPIRWCVQGMLPEGLTLLAGKPKLGKSWLAMGVALAVADGGMAFGSIQVDPGAVLYLALEDNDRRLQSRVAKILASAAIPEDFDVATEWQRVDQGGIEAIEAWLQAHPTARLIVVDTLAKVRPARRVNGNLYDEDYEAMQGLKRLCDTYHVSCLVIHHTRKGASVDPMEEISGSNGLTGGVDGTMVLRRERGALDASLHVSGRDLEEDQSIALRWEGANAQWMILGNAAEFRLSTERQAVVNALRDAGRPLALKEIADATQQSYANIKMLLSRMAAGGLVRSGERGQYELMPDRQWTVNPALTTTNVTTVTRDTVVTPVTGVTTVTTVTRPKVTPGNTPGNTPVISTQRTGMPQTDNGNSGNRGNRGMPVTNEMSPSNTGNSGNRGNSGNSTPKVTTEIDRDKRREIAIDREIAKGDFKAARRSARDMYGNVDRARMEARIDEAEREHKANGGYGRMEGY
jgi:hypothetical protein